MSTSGFIGAFEILDGSQGTIGPWKYNIWIILCLFIVPITLNLVGSEFMRVIG